MNLEQELDEINKQLDKLLSMGANDEKLVTRKRELEAIIRKSKNK